MNYRIQQKEMNAQQDISEAMRKEFSYKIVEGLYDPIGKVAVEKFVLRGEEAHQRAGNSKLVFKVA